MIPQPRLIALALILILAAAASVSSQDVSRLAGSDAPWPNASSSHVPQAKTTSVVASDESAKTSAPAAAGFPASFRDDSYRTANLLPLGERVLRSESLRHDMLRYETPRYDSIGYEVPLSNSIDVAATKTEPSPELLPPVKRDLASLYERPSIADEQIDTAINFLPPVEELKSSKAQPNKSEGFERLDTPQPAAILEPEMFDPDAAAGSSGTVAMAADPTKKIWSGNVELGLDGTEGNSQTFNFHIGFDLKRKTKCNIFKSSLDYDKSNSDAVNTANRLFQEARLERPHCRTSWTWYVHESTDYDEFQPWNVQINADTGIGYQILDNDATELTGRFGGGCSHEIGGPDEAYVPELLFGAELEHRLSKRQKFKLSVEYFPDVTHFSEFRMVDRAAWEILLDSAHNLSLSINATNTVNRPNPGGKESDLDYSAVLLWSF